MTLDDRIRAYLEKVPPCIAGQGGDTHLFKVACTLYQGFALEPETVLTWLHHFNQKCQPPWDSARLIYKAAAAVNAHHDKPRGYLLGSGGLSYSKTSETSERYANPPSNPTEIFRIKARKYSDDPDDSKSIYRLKSKCTTIPTPPTLHIHNLDL
jgi:hypothetical protein